MADYVTLDSGDRQEFPSGMRRDTQDGKPRYDLLDGAYLRRIAMLMGRGAEKYGDNNWRKADSDEEFRRFRASAYRHFMQWFYGDDEYYFPAEDEDPRSVKEDHAAAVAFNIAAAEYVKDRLAKERRYDALLGVPGFRFPEELRTEVPASWEVVWADGRKTKESGTVGVAKVPSWWDGEELDPWDESGKDEEG